MGQMADDLFERILDECAGHEVHTFEPFLNNEPFLDRKLPERLDRIRARMPGVHLQVDTNLTVLTEAGARSIARNVDALLISAHGITAADYEAVMPKVRFERFLANLDLLLAQPGRERVRMSVNCVNVRGDDEGRIRDFWRARGLDVVVTRYVDRAGNVKAAEAGRAGSHGVPEGTGRPAAKPRLGGCWNTDIPLMKMNISWNGDVVLCCMDWRRAEVLGNVREQTIEEVWNSPAYWRVRDALYGGGAIHDSFLCFRCKNPRSDGRHAKFW